MNYTQRWMITPHPPRSIRCISIMKQRSDAGKAQLTWTSGETGGLRVISYRIVADPPDVGPWHTPPLADDAPESVCAPTSLVLTGLTPGQRYRFSVFATSLMEVESDGAALSAPTQMWSGEYDQQFAQNSARLWPLKEHRAPYMDMLGRWKCCDCCVRLSKHCARPDSPSNYHIKVQGMVWNEQKQLHVEADAVDDWGGGGAAAAEGVSL